MEAINNVIDLVHKIPIKNDFSDSDKAVLGIVKGMKMDFLQVVRTPIASSISSMLNILTLGDWKRQVAKSGLDSVFHLFLVMSFKGTGKRYILEKNDTVRFKEFDGGINHKSEIRKITIPRGSGVDIDTFLDKTKALMGGKFWIYEAFTSNCQDFVLNCLSANGYLTPQLRDFVKQDFDTIVKGLPSYTKDLANKITGTSARLKRFT